MSARVLIVGGVSVCALGLSLVWFWSHFPDSNLIKLFAAARQPEIASGVNKFALALTACVFIFTLSLNVTALIVSRKAETPKMIDDEASLLILIIGIALGALFGCFIGSIVGGQVISASVFIGGLFVGLIGLIATAAVISFSSLSYSLNNIFLFGSLGLAGAGLVGALVGVHPALTFGAIIGCIAGLLGSMSGYEVGQWIGANLEHDPDLDRQESERRKSKDE
jgi:Ca2+/Na+ antiporter